ncbi:uncharacterized protein C8orf88 homolog [Cololabis saira]|uniref:uncharacterized protein C8orf88 homolog n=1 Tax=Cololabis saira TaxID=129043 RepID=UPI002AD4144D|nr:uncharacterized protein C8orf88 homolog [Cololabis saira]
MEIEPVLFEPRRALLDPVVDARMEISRRRMLKHLEPARPLRRCSMEPQFNHPACAWTVMDEETNVVENFYKTVNLHPEKKARLSYTRDFLIGLASCSEAKKKPEYLPDHPIVLSEARDPWHLGLGDTRDNGGKGDMVAEGSHSP